MNTSFKLSVIGLAVSLSACSMLETEKVDYRSAATVKAPTLDIPPDLTQLSKTTHYAVVGDAVYASGMKTAAQAPKIEPTIATLAVGDVRIERAGNQRWLVVRRPADKLWNPVKEFWQTSGFVLATEQNDLGIMETDWAKVERKLRSLQRQNVERFCLRGSAKFGRLSSILPVQIYAYRYTCAITGTGIGTSGLNTDTEFESIAYSHI